MSAYLPSFSPTPGRKVGRWFTCVRERERRERSVWVWSEPERQARVSPRLALSRRHQPHALVRREVRGRLAGFPLTPALGSRGAREAGRRLLLVLLPGRLQEPP